MMIPEIQINPFAIVLSVALDLKGKKGESFTSKQLNIGLMIDISLTSKRKSFHSHIETSSAFFEAEQFQTSGCEEGPSHPTAYVPGSSSSSSSHLSSFYFSTKLRLHLSFQMSDVQLEMKTDTSINQSPEELKSVRRYCSLSLV